MSDRIVSVEGLGKKYRLTHQHQRQPYTSLRDVLTDKTKSVARRLWSAFRPSDTRHSTPDTRPSVEDFWALKNVSFDVKQGEVVGIIGRNGAGKSTLLKILSRITEPTEGRVHLKGRVASLLEVGTGFHPELTGRENIFFNGAILGMTKAEIKSKFDEIVAFAEIEKFLDTPVKRYSSGMYVRLAFAVAAHLEPEILIIDEVLAVGDVEFQQKCLGKMQNVSRREGRTVLFVSHNMAAVQTLCHRAVYLHSGTIKAVGGVEPLVRHYLADTSGARASLPATVPIGRRLKLLGLCVTPTTIDCGASLRFSIDFHAHEPTRVIELSLLIYTAEGTRIAILDLRPCGLPANLPARQNWQAAGEITSLPLVEGTYSLGLYLNTTDFAGNLLDLITFTVGVPVGRNGHAPYAAVHRGVVELDFTAGFSQSALP